MRDADEREPQSRVLVIGGRPSEQDMLVRRLEAGGFETRTAREGSEALEVTREHRPGVVLYAAAPGEPHAVAFCRAVKSDRDLRCTHVVVLADRSSRGEAATYLDAGADDFLEMSADPAELMARIKVGLRVRQFCEEMVDEEHRKVLLEMAATLGHEVNNPLTALFGHLELVIQYLDRGESGKMRHHLEVAGEVASRIGRVAHRLMIMAEPRLKDYLGGQQMLDLGSDGAADILSSLREQTPAASYRKPN